MRERAWLIGSSVRWRALPIETMLYWRSLAAGPSQIFLCAVGMANPGLVGGNGSPCEQEKGGLHEEENQSLV
jgi:hypothetical protein